MSVNTTAEKIVVDVPTHFVFNKKVLISVAAGAVVGVGATLLAEKIRERRIRKSMTETIEGIEEATLPKTK